MNSDESAISLTALREAIVEKGSQSALAREINVSQATIWKWLHELHPVTAEAAVAIARSTSVTRERLRPDLYGDEGEIGNVHHLGDKVSAR